MPVKVECYNSSENFSAQDRTDLEKLFADYPSTPISLDAICAQTNEAGQTLFAARFNNRLLGAAFITLNNEQAQLDKLCVRKITRERLVGRDLLRGICEALIELKQAELVVDACIDDAGFSQFMQKQGFEQQGQRFSLSLG